MQNSSYMLPQEPRLLPSDAECGKFSGKIKRVENEFVEFDLLDTLLEINKFLTYRKIAN